MSHLSYCISCWGGLPDHRLSKIFALQKRCVRLLLGKITNFDHVEFYMTCARARTIDQHRTEKSHCLEHTKPLFNEHGILTIQNLYIYYTFMETFKVLKFFTPSSIRDLIKFLPRNEKLSLMVPKVKLDVTQQNFVFKATKIWNDCKDKIFNRCIPSDTGIIIPGNSKNSDLSSSLGYIKTKLKDFLLSSQKSGNQVTW